jgi:hypothetical protein
MALAQFNLALIVPMDATGVQLKSLTIDVKPVMMMPLNKRPYLLLPTIEPVVPGTYAISVQVCMRAGSRVALTQALRRHV